MSVCKAIIYLSVLLTWRTASYFIGSKCRSAYSRCSQHSYLTLKSDGDVVLLTDVSIYLDALRFPSQRLKVSILVDIG